MRGLNTKERQRATAWMIYLSALVSLPAALMDTLFVNHEYQSFHWSFDVGIKLVIVMFWVSVSMSSAWRALQRVALAWFLCVGVGTAVLARFGLQTPEAQVIGKMLVVFWWVALILMVADWWVWRFSKSTAIVESKESHYDLIADKARAFFLERLRRQATDSGCAFSDLELRFLDYSRIISEPDAKSLEDQFFQVHDYASFKQRVRALTAEAVKCDRAYNPKALKEYYRLLRQLKKGKHDQQLVLLVERGILDGRTGTEELRDWALYILIGLALVAMIWAFAIWTPGK